jgi:hypothetical protein
VLPKPASAVVPLPANDPQTALALWASGVSECVTNLAQDDPDCEYLVLTAMGACDRKTRNMVGATFRMVGYCVHPAGMADDETGEVFSKLRIVILCDDGTTFSSTSNGILRVIRELARFRGRGRWHPSVEARIMETPLEGGKSYCTLQVSRNAPSVKPPKK